MLAIKPNPMQINSAIVSMYPRNAIPGAIVGRIYTIQQHRGIQRQVKCHLPRPKSEPVALPARVSGTRTILVCEWTHAIKFPSLCPRLRALNVLSSCLIAFGGVLVSSGVAQYSLVLMTPCWMA